MQKIPYAYTQSTISPSVVTAKRISTASAVCPVRTLDLNLRRSKVQKSSINKRRT